MSHRLCGYFLEVCPHTPGKGRLMGRLTFSWMTPLMKYGHKVYLTESDLWGLRRSDRSSVAGSTFSYEWEKQLQKKKPSVTWAILRAYGKSYVAAGVFKACQDVLAFVQPQLLRL